MYSTEAGGAWAVHSTPAPDHKRWKRSSRASATTGARSGTSGTFTEPSVTRVRSPALPSAGASTRFGKHASYPFIAGLPGTPEIIEFLETEKDAVSFGGAGYSHTAYLREPAKATALHALKVPESGGDTSFANSISAHESLSEGRGGAAARLRGVNDSEPGYPGGRAAAMSPLAGMGRSSVGDTPVRAREPDRYSHRARALGGTARELRCRPERTAPASYDLTWISERDVAPTSPVWCR